MFDGSLAANRFLETTKGRCSNQTELTAHPSYCLLLRLDVLSHFDAIRPCATKEPGAVSHLTTVVGGAISGWDTISAAHGLSVHTTLSDNRAGGGQVHGSGLLVLDLNDGTIFL